MALTNIITDTIDLSSDTNGLKMPRGTNTERPSGKHTVEYLIVAGGGATGADNDGGGGAGGVLNDSVSMPDGTTFTLTVGEGGVGIGTYPTGAAQNGDDSVLTDSASLTLTAVGGGRGGQRGGANGQLGGSGGGGGSYLSSAGGTGGAGTPGQGNAGGTVNSNTSPYAGAGGGGAGAAGGSGQAGAAGIGVNKSSIINSTNATSAGVGEVSGSGVWFAGGGGAGSNTAGTLSGGLGGGGDGVVYPSSGGNGMANTGGGGGGCGSTAPARTNIGGSGGRGVIILRYKSTRTVTTSGFTAEAGPYTEGDYKVLVIKQGTGTVIFSASSPEPNIGETRSNTSTQKLEIYNGTEGWKSVDETLDEVAAIGLYNFNTVLYTGNGGTNQSISGVGFEADFTWIKDRDDTENHALFDTVRGANEWLHSNNTDAQTTYSGNYGVLAWNSDGFFVGNGTAVNASSELYVSWNWKAGGTPTATNVASSGAMTASSVSLNGNLESAYTPSGSPTLYPDKMSINSLAGFSIVKYTGSSTLGDTIPHGLGDTPDIIIVKNLDNASASWATWSSVFTASSETLFINADATSSTWTNRFGTVNSNTWQAGSSGATETNSSGSEMVAYSWRSIAGYSQIGVYMGTGASDNSPYVYTGFSPAWIMIKSVDAVGNWVILDNKRNTTSPWYNLLWANKNDSEVAFSGVRQISTTTDGFYPSSDGSDDLNDPGVKYLFMAFAS